ncbi:unnamed protein product [Alternaria alternata]
MTKQPVLSQHIPKQLAAVYRTGYQQFEKADKLFQDGVSRRDNQRRAVAAQVSKITNDNIDRIVTETVRESREKTIPAPMDTPHGILVDLLPHQKEGLGIMSGWMSDPTCFGGILADDMGLGKTLQIISLLVKYPPAFDHPTLIIIPSSLITTWQMEFKSKVAEDALKVLYIHSSMKGAIPKTDCNLQTLRKHNVIIVTMRSFGSELVVSNDAPYTAFMLIDLLHAGCVIVDEAHHAVNPNTQLFKALKQCRAPKRILVTGSPFRNAIQDILAIFSLLELGVFAERKVFMKAFTEPKEVNNYKVANAKQQENLNAILSTRMIRRYKEDHDKDFPLLSKEVKTFDYRANPGYKITVEVDSEPHQLLIPDESYSGQKAILTERQLASHPALALRDKETPEDPLSEESWSAVIDYLQQKGNFEPSDRHIAAGKYLRQYREQKKGWTIIHKNDPKNKKHFRCSICHQNRANRDRVTDVSRLCCVFERRDTKDEWATCEACKDADPDDSDGGIPSPSSMDISPGTSRDRFLDQTVGKNYILRFCHSCRNQEERIWCGSCNQDIPRGEFLETERTVSRFCRDCRQKLTESGQTSKLQPKRPKAIVFSPYRRSLDLFELYLVQKEGIPKDAICRIDGTVDQLDRTDIINKFQTDERPESVLLASVKCASEGLNVTTANFVLFLDVTYCPGNENQALCRAHRIKQEHPVVAFVLRANECAAEDRVFTRREKKAKHDQGIVENGRPTILHVLRPSDFELNEEGDPWTDDEGES